MTSVGVNLIDHNYIVELEEKNAYLQVSCDNLVTQRDEALDRAKAKGERAAEVIKTYRTALQIIIDLVSAKDSQCSQALELKIKSTATNALAFRREER